MVWRATCTLTGTDNNMFLAVYVMVRGSNQRLVFFFGLKVAYCKQQRHRCNGCIVIISKATADFKRITALTAPCCHLLTISSQPWLALYETSIPAFLYTQIDSHATSCTSNWQALNARSTYSNSVSSLKRKKKKEKKRRRIHVRDGNTPSRLIDA